MDFSNLIKNPLLFRKKFTVAGGKIWVLDQQNKMVVFVKQKAFKLKEDIRAYSDDSMSNEILLIKARKIMEFNAAFDVEDPKTGEIIGTFARKGFKSMIQDEWEIRNNQDQPIGKITEDSIALALVRRFLSSLVPQSFSYNVNGQDVAELKQHFNPFIKKADLLVKEANSSILDPRMIIAGSILLMAIEGRQN